MDKILFVIYTPLQLISAISTIRTYNLKNVDYIISHQNIEKYFDIFSKYFDGNQIICEQLYDKPNKYGVFLKRIIIFFNIIRKKWHIKNINELKQKYNKLFIPSDDSSCRVIYNELKKHNRNIKLLLYDDGVGTYIGRTFFEKSFFSEFIYSILLDKKFNNNIQSIYCFHPEIVNIKDIDIFKIDTFKDMDIFLQKKDILNIYLNRKIIFLDQGLSLNNKIEDCLKILLKYFNKEDIIVKKHPRIESEIDYSEYIVSNDGLPVEAVFSSLDYSNSLIISHSSTGSLTPYLLMNKSPQIIMLLNIDFNSYNTKIIEECKILFSKINTIKKENYIKTPKNVEEFENIIRKVQYDIRESSYIN